MGAKGKGYDLGIKGEDGWRLPAGVVLDTDDQRKQYLAPARENRRHILCYCQDPPIAMSVALRRETGRYYLTPARRASKGGNFTPPKHRTDCRLYHGDRGPSAREGETLPGVEVGGDDTVRVYLAAALGDPEAQPERPPARTDTRREAAARRTRERIGFPYLLRMWWTRAGLTAWSPDPERSPWVDWYEALSAEARKIKVTKKYRLADVLYLPQPFSEERKEAIEAEYRDFVSAAMVQGADGEAVRPRLLAGVVKTIEDGEGGAKRMHLWQKKFTLVLPAHMVESYQEQAKAGQTIEAPQQEGERIATAWVFVLVLARPRASRGKPGHYWWKASEIAAITIHSRTAIPVESSYELQVAEALVTAGRAFVKPFPGHAGELEVDGMTPDFVCVDRTPPVYLEVYGRMGDPEYARHTEEKRRRYRRQGIIPWEWDPLTEQRMPDLPE